MLAIGINCQIHYTQINAQARNHALALSLAVVGVVALLGIAIVLLVSARHRALKATEEHPAPPADVVAA